MKKKIYRISGFCWWCWCWSWHKNNYYSLPISHLFSWLYTSRKSCLLSIFRCSDFLFIYFFAKNEKTSFTPFLLFWNISQFLFPSFCVHWHFFYFLDLQMCFEKRDFLLFLHFQKKKSFTWREAVAVDFMKNGLIKREKWNRDF